jgi:hypothetical protein
MENLHSLLSIYYAIDHAIDMGLVSVKKVPQSLILRNHGAPLGMFFQTKNCAFKTFVPSKSSHRVGGVNVFEEQRQISLGARHQLNEISHIFA